MAANSTSVVAYQPDDSAAAIIDACRGAVAWRPEGGGPAESHRLPNEGERRLLERRRAHLALSARGCGVSDEEKRKAAGAVGLMLGGYLRTRNLDEQAKKHMIAGMVGDLVALPAWAIERACERFRRGEVEGQSLDWAPSSAAVYQQAVREMAGLRVEERAINETLQLQPVQHDTPEARARLAEKGRDWLTRKDPRAAQLTAGEHKGTDGYAATREAMAETARSTAARWGGNAPMIGGCPVSPEMAALLRLSVEGDRA